MPWLEVLTLADGSRVESSMLTVAESDGGPERHAFRVLTPDGSVREFSTLSKVLVHLREHHDLTPSHRAGKVERADAELG